ncbi:MAG: ABC transporter substrate-binding protein [Treponema sp.]|jgi:peptide/nickel transport system substrate-binding protein|nr:ABC transporter substrate-binding protein [Treponema sp.]
MRKIKNLKFALFFLIIIALFPSCRKDGRKTGELRYGFTSEPSTLDPLSPANTADGRSILFNVFEGLVKPDTSGIMKSCIAETLKIEENNRVYIFTLREGVRFHDGSELSSADVKFSLDTAIAAGFTGLDRIENVSVTGKNQVKVTLKKPDPDFLPYMTIGIVKADNTDREKNITGTGPFYIESYMIQQNLVLKKFDDYWQKGMPHLKKVTIVFFANNDALMVALRGGGIDGASITGPMAALLDHRKTNIFNSHSAAVQLLALNNKVPPLDDVRVRRALNYGIDVQDIIDTAFFGVGAPSGSPVIPGLTAYYENSLEYPYDPDTAISMLPQNGFELEITVPSNYSMHVDTAQVIANQLSKVGVAVKIKQVDWAAWLSDVYFGRNYMATIISLDSPIVSPRSFLSRYYSTSGSNFINFSNSNFDKIYDSILAETDEAKRVKLYRDAQRAVTENAASVYIQDILYYKALNKSFDGVLEYPLYAVDFASIYEKEKN